jgi:hypothetical protein
MIFMGRRLTLIHADFFCFICENLRESASDFLSLRQTVRLPGVLSVNQETCEIKK